MSTTPESITAAQTSPDELAASPEIVDDASADGLAHATQTTDTNDATDGPSESAAAADDLDPAEESRADAAGQAEDDEDDETGAPAGAAAGADHTEDLVREGEIAADFLEALLDIADLAGDLEVDIEGNRAAVAIVDSEDGAAPRRLVGPGGSVLDALQELARLAVQAETGERSRLMLDVAGYRSDRRSALVKTARRAIAEVKESGTSRELEPMTAFERKVVHDEVLAAGLRSESEGAEPARYVVIQPSA
jgi:spoIIIJ-associated protein